MNILLLRSEGSNDIDSTGSVYAPSFMPPLSLIYIASELENNGHKVTIIDFSKEPIIKSKIFNYLNNVDLVGISVYTDNLKEAHFISKIVKEYDEKIPIIIGGPHCIFHKEKSLNHIPEADICVIGEGENIIVDIIKSIEGKINLSEISGIFYKKDKKINKGKPVKVIKNLDSISFPSRNLIKKYTYGKIGNKYFFKPEVTSILTSRGCPYQCRFCARYGNAIKGWGSRMRSADNVLQELKEINGKYGSVMIVDDNFIQNKKRVHKIMDGIIENHMDIELLILGARVDSADKELYTKMRKANVKLIGYGIESGNQDVLDYYKKGFSLDQVKYAVNLSRKMGFKTMATFIIGAPIETKVHFENTIKFSCSLPLDFVIYGVLYYEMGSDLWKEALINNKISKDEFLVSADVDRGLGIYNTDYLNEYTKRAYRNFYLRPKYILDQIFRGLYYKDIRSLRSGFRFLTLSN